MKNKFLNFIISLFCFLSLIILSQKAYSKTYEVAYLSASSANTWLSASVREMQIVANANDINITEFDGNSSATGLGLPISFSNVDHIG